MDGLFSENWCATFTRKWNNCHEITTELAAANFNDIVALGYIDAPAPEIFIHISHGRVTAVNTANHETHDTVATWDLRAEPQQWLKWRGVGPGLTGLGIAVANRQIVFIQGDYRKMIRQPLLAASFIKFFSFL